MYGERLAEATRHERIVGGAVANRFRTPFGSGWALVGDAGYLKDPVTAQGSPMPSTTLSGAPLRSMRHSPGDVRSTR